MEKDFLLEVEQLYAEGDLTAAEEKVSQLLRDIPQSSDAYYWKGLLAHKRQKFDQAIEAFEKVLEYQGDHGEAKLALSILYNDLGFYEEGAKLFKELESKTSQLGSKLINQKIATLHIALAKNYAMLRRFDEALEEITKAQQLCPHDADLKVEIARIYRETNEFDQAIALLERVLSKHKGHGKAWLELGLVKSAKKDLEGAKAAWQKARELSPVKEKAETYLRFVDKDLRK